MADLNTIKPLNTPSFDYEAAHKQIHEAIHGAQYEDPFGFPVPAPDKIEYEVSADPADPGGDKTVMFQLRPGIAQVKPGYEKTVSVRSGIDNTLRASYITTSAYHQTASPPYLGFGGRVYGRGFDFVREHEEKVLGKSKGAFEPERDRGLVKRVLNQKIRPAQASMTTPSGMPQNVIGVGFEDPTKKGMLQFMWPMGDAGKAQAETDRLLNYLTELFIWADKELG